MSAFCEEGETTALLMKEFALKCPSCNGAFTLGNPAIKTNANSVCKECYDLLRTQEDSAMPATAEVDAGLMAFAAGQTLAGEGGAAADVDMDPTSVSEAPPSLCGKVDDEDVDEPVATSPRLSRAQADLACMQRLVQTVNAMHADCIETVNKQFDASVACLTANKSAFIQRTSKATEAFCTNLMVAAAQQAARGEAITIPSMDQTKKALNHLAHSASLVAEVGGLMPFSLRSETVAVSVLYKSCMRAFENNYKMDATPEERPDDKLLDFCTSMARVVVTNTGIDYEFEDALTIGNVVKSITMFRWEIFDDRMCRFAGAFTACLRRAVNVIPCATEDYKKWKDWLKERARYMLEEFASHGNKISRERRLMFVEELGIPFSQLGEYARQLYTDAETEEGSMVRMLLGFIDAKSVDSMRDMGRENCMMVVRVILEDKGSSDYFSKYYAAELAEDVNKHIALLCNIDQTNGAEVVAKGEARGADGTTVPMAFQRFIEERIPFL